MARPGSHVLHSSDFIHQIGKVPVPLKLGKLLMPKTRGGGEITRGGLAPLLLGGGGMGGLPQKFLKM